MSDLQSLGGFAGFPWGAKRFILLIYIGHNVWHMISVDLDSVERQSTIF